MFYLIKKLFTAMFCAELNLKQVIHRAITEAEAAGQETATFCGVKFCSVLKVRKRGRKTGELLYFLNGEDFDMFAVGLGWHFQFCRCTGRISLRQMEHWWSEDERKEVMERIGSLIESVLKARHLLGRQRAILDRLNAARRGNELEEAASAIGLIDEWQTVQAIFSKMNIKEAWSDWPECLSKLRCEVLKKHVHGDVERGQVLGTEKMSGGGVQRQLVFANGQYVVVLRDHTQAISSWTVDVNHFTNTEVELALAHKSAT